MINFKVINPIIVIKAAHLICYVIACLHEILSHELTQLVTRFQRLTLIKIIITDICKVNISSLQLRAGKYSNAH